MSLLEPEIAAPADNGETSPALSKAKWIVAVLVFSALSFGLAWVMWSSTALEGRVIAGVGAAILLVSVSGIVAAMSARFTPRSFGVFVAVFVITFSGLLVYSLTGPPRVTVSGLPVSLAGVEAKGAVPSDGVPFVVDGLLLRRTTGPNGVVIEIVPDEPELKYALQTDPRSVKMDGLKCVSSEINADFVDIDVGDPFAVFGRASRGPGGLIVLNGCQSPNMRFETLVLLIGVFLGLVVLYMGLDYAWDKRMR